MSVLWGHGHLDRIIKGEESVKNFLVMSVLRSSEVEGRPPQVSEWMARDGSRSSLYSVLIFGRYRRFLHRVSFSSIPSLSQFEFQEKYLQLFAFSHSR